MAACLAALTLTGCGQGSKSSGTAGGTTNAAPKSAVKAVTNAAPTAMRAPGRTNLVAAMRPVGRTNPPPGTARALLKTNAVAGAPKPAAGTSAVASTSAASASKPAGFAERFRQFAQSPYFYPGVVVVALILGFGVAFLYQFFKSKSEAAAPGASGEGPARALGRPPAKQARKALIHSCNVLQLGAQERHLWYFGSRGRGFVLNREQTSFANEALPAKIINKDWSNLFQRKINIAWLPSNQVFLRVAQFPVSDFDETLSMVELQLEKLSPIPVTQIVWSVQVLPHTDATLQTVIVMIAARNGVEEFLGQLEGLGYLADRLELPRLDLLHATTSSQDGAWIYPEPVGQGHGALVAWWHGGVLQNLALLTLPAANRPAGLKEQLLQMTWAGELEGWLTQAPAWHLVADGPTLAEWEPPLREGLEQPVAVVAAPPPAALAAMTATRVARTEQQANLLPLEFSTRYQQQFVDRLWMGGLGAVIGLYLVGVIVYFAWLQFALVGTNQVEQQVANLGPTYTNALQFKARLQVLQDRQDLKFAALDCWKAVAELLPDGVTLEGYNFTDGKKLSINGVAPADMAKRLNDFDADIRKATKDGQRLFDSSAGEHLTWHSGASGTVTWSCVLELKRTEAL
jgi:hypothetical protein